MSATTTRSASYARFHDMPACQEEPDGTRHWVTRGANFAIVVTRAAAGATLARREQPDEYMVVLPEDVAADIETDVDRVEANGDSLTILPPGNSRVTLRQPGYVYRIFSHRATDMLALATNASSYAEGVSDVAPLVPWPDPLGGFKLRHYPLSEHVRAGSTMRLFRSTNLMVNIFLKSRAPRDTAKMTPHAHGDHEQASLAILGDYVHHLRYPWTPDMTTWREDEHGAVGSPSVIVIPPNVVHTTQSTSAPTRLIDVFAPPRADFSLKPGLVCNADEYPLPPALENTPDPGSAA